MCKNCLTTAMHKRPEMALSVLIPTNVFGWLLLMVMSLWCTKMNTETGQMSKCDFCVDLLAEGKNATIRLIRPLNAIKFGKLKIYALNMVI